MSEVAGFNYSLQHRYRVYIGGDLVASARSVENLGNVTRTTQVELANGEIGENILSVRGRRIVIRDARVENSKWHEWLLAAWLTKDNYKRDLYIEDIEAGIDWFVAEAFPVSNSVSYSRDVDGIVTITVTLACRRVSHSNEQPPDYDGDYYGQIAHIGDVEIWVPGRIQRKVSAAYATRTIPGFDGDNSEWVAGHGEEITLPFHIFTSKTSSAAESVEELKALVRKDPNGPAPRIVQFVYGDFSLPAVIVESLEIEVVKRDMAGRMEIVKGEITLKEQYVDTEHTPAEDRKIGVYSVVGDNETYHSIAYKLWGDESLWRAIRAWNPRPAEQGPVLPQGTEIAIPPYMFVEQFRASGNVFPWTLGG